VRASEKVIQRFPQTDSISPQLRPAKCDAISSPQLEERIPTARAERSAVLGHAEARDTVVVTREATDLLARERVPHVAVEIVVPGKQETARDRMRYRRDAAKDFVVSVLHELVAAAHVEEAARRVIRARGERVAVGKKRDSIDV